MDLKASVLPITSQRPSASSSVPLTVGFIELGNNVRITQVVGNLSDTVSSITINSFSEKESRTNLQKF